MKQCHKEILNLKKINYLLTENASQEVKKEFLQPLASSLLPAEYFMHNFQISNKEKKKIVYLECHCQFFT